MENFKITPKALNGEITAPSSKSFAHRLLISAYLSNREITIDNIGSSDDVLVTLNALKTMGAKININGDSVTVKKGEIPTNKVVIDCGESGSSLRFLMPVASALGIKAEFTGKGKLLSRPIVELVSCLNENGANIDGYNINGKLLAGKFVIDGGVSSQYITGLLLALSVLDGESEIIIKGNLVSTPYIDITIEVLNDMGASVVKTDSGFKVLGGYRETKNDFIVEGDWSGLAFFLSAGAIGGKVKINGVNLNSVQGDRKIVDILKSFGAKITTIDNSITVERDKLNAITVDMEDIPDLCQIVAVVSAFANGKTKICGVERLKIKESDRIKAIIDMLNLAGIFAEYKDNSITITGGKPTGAEFTGGKDHRTVMSSSILASLASSDSKILGAEFYRKSYPDFVRDFKKLGGEINVDIFG